MEHAFSYLRLSCDACCAGFRHSAFTFGAESAVAKSNINGAKIPPGQLVNFVQKGIMYTELERSVSDNSIDASATEPFAVLSEQKPAATTNASASSSKQAASSSRKSAASSGPAPMDTESSAGVQAASPAASSGGSMLTDEQVTTLSGHTSEVFICAWSPTTYWMGKCG